MAFKEKLKHLRENKQFWAVLKAVGLVCLLLALGIFLVPRIKNWRENLVKARLEEQKKQQEEQEKKAKQERKIPVRAYKVSRRDFKDNLPVLGVVKGVIEIDLKFPVAGVVKSFNFKEGELVKKGELLAMLDQKDSLLKVSYNESRLKAAETALEAAQRKLEIHEDLYRIGAIIEARLQEVRLERDNARYQMETLRAELDSARAELDKTVLYAPQEGVIGVKEVEASEFITPTDRVCTLIDIHEVHIDVGVIERDINKVALGQGASVTVDAYPTTEFWGVVDNIFPVVEGGSRTLTAKVRVPNSNQSGLLLPGMFARVNVNLAEFEKAILVPSVSVNDLDHDGIFESVYVVDDQDLAHVRPVKVSYDKSTDFWVIQEGLKEGELVIVEAPEELKEGAKVQVIEVQEG
ncbi:MAG: efflux RND transporter periplasmic adaptor subunit, partial [Candidatus Omnitrophica bacterium]|nr:efflux RND transporter periplasmic adaptor subunit [Candidatus Omnitrophota bacterium]